MLRLAVAAVAPLSPDEAYYWIWSRALAPGYLDHPPMVALCIRAGTVILGDTALGVRLFAPLLAGLGSVLLAGATADLLDGDREAGILAAALLNATLFLAVGAVMMTPDTPLLFFWCLTLWALGRVLATGVGLWWLLVGLGAGLAMVSKYSAALLWAGIATWLLVAPIGRAWLRRPHPWAGAAVGLVVFAPVLAWNVAHGWASVAKQGGRVAAWQPSRVAQFVAELIGGQIALATPLIFLLCLAGMVRAARRAAPDCHPGWTLITSLSVLPALLFLLHALGDRVQGNWPVVLYPAAAIAAAALAGPFWRRLRRPALALGGAMTLLAYVQAIAAPLPLSIRADPSLLRLAGWRGFADEVESMRIRQIAGFVAADGYGPASELAWWLPAGVAVIGAEPRWSLFDLPAADIAGRAGLLVRSARRGDDPDPRPWAELVPLGTLDRQRDSEVAETFRLYRVVARPESGPMVALPRPR
jgi:4-amino-4-deoxy-L-arabinose transferase-like glycosyltransferase